MKFYLASRYGDRIRMREYAKRLREAGHEVTSTWIWTDWPESKTGAAHAPPEAREEYALTDMHDLRRSEALIGFNCAGEGSGRGGRHVEFGAALVLTDLYAHHFIVWIGEEEHIFHYHPKVVKHPDFDSFMEWLLSFPIEMKTVPIKEFGD